mmetsp:Transcript_6555/g.11389  ORF Transcript_6555/g.11389 Transcript_6555/m.11389 type:complete len:360 (+) Transcript_6555:91-1170(+)
MGELEHLFAVHNLHEGMIALTYILLFLLKVNIAASVDMTVFCQRLDRKAGIAVGVVCQFVILPFCGFLIAKLLEMDYLYGMALMVIMTSPGGSYSNWLCSVFNSDLAMSVAMTGVSTLVGVVMLPVNLTMYGRLLYPEAAMGHHQIVIIFQALAIILVALLLGLSISQALQSEKWRERCVIVANFVGISLLLLSLFASEHKSRTPVWRKPWTLHVSIAAPIICAIFLSLVISSLPALKLRKPERVAVVIEACYQNPGLASSIVLAMFKREIDAGDAIAVPLLYGTYEAIFLVTFCIGAHYCGWTLVDPNETSLWEAIRGNYQKRALLQDEDSPRHQPLGTDADSDGPSQVELVSKKDPA